MDLSRSGWGRDLPEIQRVSEDEDAPSFAASITLPPSSVSMSEEINPGKSSVLIGMAASRMYFI
jgi:hypothetical protein